MEPAWLLPQRAGLREHREAGSPGEGPAKTEGGPMLSLQRLRVSSNKDNSVCLVGLFRRVEANARSQM